MIIVALSCGIVVLMLLCALVDEIGRKVYFTIHKE